MAEDEDFKQQLELEAVEKSRQQTDQFTYTDPNDGTVYEWNHEKQAWFPKIDDHFIASYQSNYQYQETSEAGNSTSNACATAASEEAEQKKKGEKRKANDPCWFQIDDAHNTNVYVTGLPADTKEEEFIELMSKCGLIMKDADTMKYKIKLYKNADGTFKGDGRCCYIKIESVELALDILDGYLFKGKQIHVERAQFQLKGQYDPSKKPRKKKSKDKEKLKKKLEKLFDWRPDKLRGMRSKNENTVIIKNMFDPKEFEADATLILEYQKDVREECSKCGEVKKVVVYDRNPEGVVAVTFAEPEMADQCINVMNGRWFAARQLSAASWDGKTKYKVIETEEEREKRIKEWETFLQQGKKDQEPISVVAQQSQMPYMENNNDHKDSQVVPQDMYELAGETDSSGDSETETGDQEVTTDRMAPPVMSASGSFTFSVNNARPGTSHQ